MTVCMQLNKVATTMHFLQLLMLAAILILSIVTLRFVLDNSILSNIYCYNNHNYYITYTANAPVVYVTSSISNPMLTRHTTPHTTHRIINTTVDLQDGADVEPADNCKLYYSK